MFKYIDMSDDEYINHRMDDAGLCVECGAIVDGVEPDARGYECPECRARAVMGIEEALLCGRVKIVDD
jgi:hypothetical protein